MSTLTFLAATPSVPNRDPGIADRVGKVGRALGQHPAGLVEVLEDVGDRVLVLVAEQFGQPLGQALDPVDQFRRTVEQRAEPARARRDDRATLRSQLLDRRRALDRAVELDFADAGEADALDLRGGALKHRCFIVDVDPHPDELRPVGQQRDRSTCPTGTPEKVTPEPLLSPLTACAK